MSTSEKWNQQALGNISIDRGLDWDRGKTVSSEQKLYSHFTFNM